jgi:hypothetical protein
MPTEAAGIFVERKLKTVLNNTTTTNKYRLRQTVWREF